MRTICTSTTVLVVAVLVATGSTGWTQVNLLQNGDWSTGDESSWTQWRAAWGSEEGWSVTSSGPTPPEGTLDIGITGGASFGWYQVVIVPKGHNCIVDASWEGDISVGGNGWCEVMFFSVSELASDTDIVSRIDAGAAADIAFKKDTFGPENPPTTWSWENASLSPHPGGTSGGVQSYGRVVVALKLGGDPGGGNSASYDNIVLMDLNEGEPTTVQTDWKKFP